MTAGLRSAITLIVLTAILVAMAVWGFQKATEPFPQSAQPEEVRCQNVRVKTRLYRKEVQVSVFNASKRAGLANDSLDRIRGLGFVAGDVGNAPDGTKVRRVEVWAKSEDDPRALLLASMFRPEATVRPQETLPGPGVSLVVGQRYRGPQAARAPKFIKLAEPVETCLD